MSEDVKLHTQYTLKDGTVVPSVTTIIGNNLGWNKQVLIGWTRKMAMQGIDPYKVRDKAGSIGTLAHKLVEYHLHRQLGHEGWEVDFLDNYSKNDQEAAQRGFDAFLDWEDQVNLEPIEMEDKLVSEWHHYGGTVDLIALVNGTKRIVDFKTSNGLYREHRIQISAYQKLYKENYGEDLPMGILHLQKDTGEFNHKPFQDLSNEWETFLHCLGLEQLREKIPA